MSYKLKLGVALAVAALALPTLAAAQDPTTRLDITVVGAVLTDESEDVEAIAAPAMPVVYEDESMSATESADTSIASADLSHGVESE